MGIAKTRRHCYSAVITCLRRAMARQNAAAEERATRLAEENATLQRELAQRPTPDQYASLQRQVDIMARQLSHLAAQKAAASSKADRCACLAVPSNVLARVSIANVYGNELDTVQQSSQASEYMDGQPVLDAGYKQSGKDNPATPWPQGCLAQRNWCLSHVAALAPSPSSNSCLREMQSRGTRTWLAWACMPSNNAPSQSSLR
jgi:hypothetical protein